MTDDRELLEKAAKAAGIAIGGWDTTDSAFYVYHKPHSCLWNPLTDDGDALRLAVKLEIPVSPYCGYVRADAYILEFDGRDRMEVIRRAIVMAAAALGDKP